MKKLKEVRGAGDTWEIREHPQLPKPDFSTLLHPNAFQGVGDPRIDAPGYSYTQNITPFPQRGRKSQFRS